MSLRSVIQSSADTLFKLLSSIVHDGTYQEIVDDGFSSSQTDYPISIITDSFTAEDIQKLSFGGLIQPLDIKGIVRYAELPEVLRTTDKVTVISLDGSQSRTYAVVSYSIDAADVLATLLLRSV